MQHENSSVPLPHPRAVVPWNKGRFVGPKTPFKPKQVWAIRLHLQREQRVRDLAMFDLAIDSKLRGCDLVSLKIGQVVMNAAARHRATIVPQKTGRPVQFELTEQTRERLTAWLNHRGGTLDDYVLPEPQLCRQAP
jgi:integrase